MTHSGFEQTKEHRQRRTQQGLPPPGLVEVHTEATLFRSVSMSVGRSRGLLPSTAATKPISKSMAISKSYHPTITYNSAEEGVLHESHSSFAAAPSSTNGSAAGFNPSKEHGTDRISRWRVTKLRPLPLYYPLERTAITIHPESLQALTDDILAFMKARSIFCVYSDEAGRADGLTVNLLQFAVQLWREGGPPAADGPPGVIVEIPRRQGCCIEMQQLRQELIHHLTHNSDHDVCEPLCDSSAKNNNRPIDKCLSTELLQAWVEQSTRYEVDRAAVTLPWVLRGSTCCEGPFNAILALLRSRMIDQNRLGLEALSMIVDLSKTTIKLAVYASSKILADADVQALLIPYFDRVEISQYHQNPHSVESGDDDGDCTLDYEQGKFFGKMHILALKVVSQALETKAYVDGKKASEVATDRSSNIESTTISLSTPFWNHALQAMMYDTHVSHLRPMEAALSIRCLRLLHTIVPKAWSENAIFDASAKRPFTDMLLDARSHGRRYHSELEQETQALLTQLGLAC